MKKRTAVCLLLTLALSLCACNGDGITNTPDEIQIYYWKSGFGLEFMHDMVAEFNGRQDEYTAKLEYNADAGAIIQTLSLGGGNTYDLYFTMLNTTQYYKDFASLDGVLDSAVDGTDVTIRDKYNRDLLAGVQNRDGTSNLLTYGNGITGIVYNADIIDGVRFKTPNTTDELEILTAELKNSGITPWLFFDHSSLNGYWAYIYYAWAAQYDGLDYYFDNLLNLTDSEGNSPSKEVMLAKDGRYQALRVMEKIITPNTVHAECTSPLFTKVQSLFLDGDAAMCPNGQWLLNEMNSTANIRMMKTPVVSTITAKLQDTAMSDATLSAIVAAIDAGENSSSLCSQGDFDRIKAARNLMYNNGAELYSFIPKYSSSVEGAEEFLRFFYSDEGSMIFAKRTKMPPPVRLTDPSKLDGIQLSAWNEDLFEYAATMNFLTMRKDMASPFMNHGMDTFARISIALPLSASNPKDRKTADDLWSMFTNKVNENWRVWTNA